MIASIPYVFAGPSTDDLIGPAHRLFDYANFDVNLHFTSNGNNGLVEVANRWRDAIPVSGFQNSRNYINEPAMAIEYFSGGRLSAEYISQGVPSSFVWRNVSTGETRAGVKYIDNASPGLWKAPAK